MSRFPVKREARAVRKVEDKSVEVVDPVTSANPWFSFRYSYTEVSAQGSMARVKSRNARYEGGRLSSEAFEGELDRSVYERMVADAERFFLGQTELFLRALTSFLPPVGKQRNDRNE